MSDAAADGVTAGAILRHARESAGLHVDTLAANLKVPVRKLEALEEDRYDLLPDAVFARALASSVCRTLKIDPQPVLQRLPQSAQPRLSQDAEGINEPFRVPGESPAADWLQYVSRPVVLTVAVLLLGALVILFLPMLQRGYEMVVQANKPEPAPAVVGAATVPSHAPAPQPAATLQAASLPGQPALPASAAAAPAVPAAPAELAAAPAMPTAGGASQAVQPAPSAPVPGGLVVFRTKGSSWVQVTDAGGTTVLRRLLGPGESVEATGALPLSVTVGDVAHTEVQVRGQPFNLAPVSRDNVARFEVK